MTAEIVVINKSAIALAADSKVTLSMGGRQKTYDTVNKLFSLSKTEPVGAMVYGNAEFMGFPWETILKEYRRRDPKKKFDTIFLWAEDLLSFLNTFFNFPADDGVELAENIGRAAIAQMAERLFDFAQAGPTREEMLEELKAELDLQIEELEAFPDFISHEDWVALGDTYSAAVTRAAATGIGENFEELSAEINTLIALSIRKRRSSPAFSGLVVAGFGERELLPSMVSYEIDGIIGGRLKCIKAKEIDVTRRNRGAIVPFAQTDMVYRFMEGVDPDYAVQLSENIHALLLQNSHDTAKALGATDEVLEQIKPALEAAVDASFDAFWKEDRRIRMEQFASPIIDMAMSLPKDELANLAESLVSLTSLQRRVSREIETVGGAVDVAVISKGDGFVWVKRKHYFNPDRNLRFVNGYFSEYANAKVDGDANGDA